MFPVFLLFLLVLFEVAYDQFLQTVVESAVELTAYQVQVGNTTNTATAQAFVDNDLCPNAIAHTLTCANLYVRMQQFNPTTCSDFHLAASPATSGALPVANKQLELTDYTGEQAGTGGAIGPTACGGSGVGFCNAGPNEYIIMTAVYTAPTFLGGLIPGLAYKYNGSYVHGTIATSAFYTEDFTAPTGGVDPC